MLGLEATTMEGICDQMLQHLVKRGKLEKEAVPELLGMLMFREQQASTAIGHACAVPHAYQKDVHEPIIVFARLAKPTDLGAPDKIPTQFVFLLLGPPGQAGLHLDALASIARLMSDDDFRYEAGRATSASAMLTAIENYEERQRPPDKSASATIEYTGKFGGGIVLDVKRRLAHYKADFVDGFHPKAVGATAFLLFACLAPAITFGGVMADQTGGQIGAVEMLAATALCGVLYSLFSGSPLIILGGTGPLLVITAILYGLCESWGLPFLAVYAWVGIWTMVLLLLLALFDAGALMRHFTRFTDEIFAALISVIFIVEAVKAILGFFRLEPGEKHDAAFLSVLLALGCFYVATSLFRFRRSRYLAGWVREFLADFGPTIAIATMTLAAVSFNEVELAGLQAPDVFAPTTEREWMVDLFAVPGWIYIAALVPAILVATLVYLDQNITARVVNAPDNKLARGSAYHLDLALVGLLVGLCSMFGLPWLVAATVRSLNHVRALATVEERRHSDGSTSERIIHTRETRVTGLVIHLLIGVSLLALPMIKRIPMPVLYGLFLYMGVMSLRGNQFFERVLLWTTDPSRYPTTHYLRDVPKSTVHRYTAVQVASLAVLWVVKMSAIAILFPVCIALLAPLRLLLGRFLKPEHLAALDSDETPEEESDRAEGT